ncbi:hypothetical protein LQZ21_12315 [Treponema sp. TIM-1]|uniref:hypothetical protein n=1 Tax=Treponema sp. TIM-1 TaxID=2898417 RepID=UPI00397FFD69
MLKKSLFLGAAALALLVLFAFVGCSNPSGETEYVDRIVDARFDYPPGTVFVNGSNARGFDELLGLLGDNGVTHIAYQGTSLTFSNTLTIPTGKTVYLEDTTSATTTLTQNIIVQPGAALVLVTDVATSTDTTPPLAGKLLVKGTVDVYGSLAIGVSALDVADYHSETLLAVYTVIGERVFVKAGGTLALKATDIRAPTDTSSHDRFTPALAWAAAGQGHLVIGADASDNGVPGDVGDDFLGPAHTVTYLLTTGVSPSASRRYTVYTEGGELPPIIPPGAFITTSAAITDTTDPAHTLTVNGGLLANNASFAAIEKLTISQVKTDNNTRIASADDHPVAGALGANSATLAAATLIDIGDYGTFYSESPSIALPADSVITLGRSAEFIAQNNAAGNTNTFDTLTKLLIGKASTVQILSSAATLTALKELELPDSATLSVPNGNVNYKLDNPVKLGSYAWLNVKYDAAAEVEFVISGKTTINSPLTVTEKSTFNVEEGATLVLEGASAGLDLMTDLTTDSGITEPPITINGTVEIGAGASLNFPEFSGFSTPGDGSKIISYGPEGKFLVKTGGSVNLGGTEYVGDATALSPSGIYQLATGAEVELSDRHLKLAKGTATLTVDNPIQAKDTLEINGILVLGNTGATYAGLSLIAGASASEGGAILTGTGKVVAGTPTNGIYPTEIVGGSGWQAKGADRITLTGDTNGGITIAATGVTTLSAQGPGATITQNPGAGSLTIAANTTIDLGGSDSAKAGQIILSWHGSTPGQITFAATTSVIQIGSTTNLTNPYASADTIGGVAFTATNLDIYTNSTASPYGPGKFIGIKTTSVGTALTAGASDDDTIIIDSTQTVTAP